VKPPRSFQWEGRPPTRLAHSSIKHELIRTYVRDYLEILTNVPKRTSLRLTLFDGFAGGGAFEENGSLIVGTPLILAEEVVFAAQRKSAERGIAFDIDLWAAEKDGANFESLRYQFESSGLTNAFPGRIHLRNGSYEIALNEAVSKMKLVKNTTGRSIFLFDQTGFNNVNLDHIRYIFDNFKNPEVILTFSVSWLVDLAKSDATFLKKVSTLGINEHSLIELLEAKNDWSPRYGGQKWIREYIARYIGSQYDTCFFLKTRPSNKDMWLLHFAKSWRARDAMMEVHYKFSNKTHFYGKPGFQMLGYDPHVDQSQLIFDFTDENIVESSISLVEDIPRTLRDKGGAEGISLLDLFRREMNDTPLTFSNFQKGVAIARDNKVVEVINSDGKPRAGARWFDREDIVRIPAQRSMWHLLQKTQ